MIRTTRDLEVITGKNGVDQIDIGEIRHAGRDMND